MSLRLLLRKGGRQRQRPSPEPEPAATLDEFFFEFGYHGVLALHVYLDINLSSVMNIMDYFQLAWAFSGFVAAISIGATVHVCLCVFSFKQRLKNRISR